MFVQHFDTLLGIYAGYPSSLCVHSKICGHAAAIEHDGTIFSCDHFVDDEHRLGNILNDNLSEFIQGEKQQKFGCGKWSNLPEKCLKCKWLQLCYGGCLRNRLNGNLNYLCEGYASIYEHTEPYFKAMLACLQRRISPSEFRQFLMVPSVGRNDPCPCLSGKKYKNCHGRLD